MNLFFAPQGRAGARLLVLSACLLLLPLLYSTGIRAVAATPNVAPVLQASPSTVQLWSTTGGVSPYLVPVSVSVAGEFTATASEPWITVVTGPSSVTIGANAGSLVPGTYRGTVTVTATDVAPVSIAVVLHVANTQHSWQDSPATLATQRPLAIDSADFNQDGRADFVVTNDATADRGRNIQVFTSTGAGFSSQTFDTAGQGLDVVTGDINGDGWIDIAATAWGSRAVDVLINDGSGAFTLTSPSLGEDAIGFDVALGDVDADGRDDLIVAIFTTNTISVIRSGPAEFAEPVTIGACSRAQSVAAGDVNGDGRLDVAALCGGDETVRVYLGDGAGAFVPSPAGALPGAGQGDLSIADLNGDGRQDVVVGGSYNAARIYLGDAVAGVTPGPQVLPAAPVVVGDVNGDGYPDLVFRDGTSAIIYAGSAGGVFTDLGRFGETFGAIDIVVADFDGDGANDVVGVWPPDGVIRALTAAPADTTATLQPPSAPTFGSPMAFVLSVAADGVTPAGTGQLFLCNEAFECDTPASAPVTGSAEFVLPVNVAINRGYHFFKARFTPSNNTLASESDAVGVNIVRADSTLTLANPEQAPVGDVPFTIVATVTPAAATGVVQFFDAARGTLLATASVVNGVATATIPGLTSGLFYTLQATYDGDANVHYSTSNYIDFYVTRGGSISLAGLTREWTGMPAGVDVHVTPADLPVRITYDGSEQVPSELGEYVVVASSTDSNRPATATGTLRITPNRNVTIDVPSLTVTYNGQPHSSTPTTSPAGLNVVVTFKNTDTGVVSTTAPVEPGWYQQLVDVSDPRGIQLNQGVGWIHIEKQRATVTLRDLVRTAVPGQLVTPTVSTDPAGLNVTLTYNGQPNLQGVGTYTVVASVEEPYWEGSATDTFVLLAPPFTLSNLDQTFDGAPKSIGVTPRTAGTPYTVMYNGSSVPPTNAGSYLVVVTSTDPAQPGSVSDTLLIRKGTATLIVSNTDQVYNGAPHAVTVTTAPANLQTTVTYGGSGNAPVTAGVYPFTVTITDPNVEAMPPHSGTLTITKATAQVTLGNLTQGDTGQPHPISVTTTPSGLAMTVTYDGSTTVPTAAGSYAVVATVNDANYAGSASGVLTVVARAATTLSAQYNGVFLPRSAPGVAIPDIERAAGTLVVHVSGGPTPVTGRVEVRDLFNNQVSTVLYTTPSTVTLPVAIPVGLPVGRHQLTLSYLGDDLHQDATLVTVFDIVRATPSITPDFPSLTTTFDGQPKSVPFTVLPAGTSYTVTYDGSTTPPSDAGTYRVVVRTNDPNVKQTSAQYTLTINRAQATITLGDLVQTADGTPKVPTAAVTPALPAGYIVDFTFDGRRNPPSRIGSYQVVASNPNVTGVATATFTLVAPISIQGGTFTYDGSPKAATVSFREPINRVRSIVYTNASYNSEVAPTNAGTYTVTATGCGGGNGCNNVVTTTLVIAPAQVSLAIDSLTNGTTGDPRPVVVTWSPSSLVNVPLTITYDGSTTPPTNAGAYALVVTLNSPNFVPQTISDAYVLTPWRTRMSLTSRQVNWTGQPQALTLNISPANAPYTLTYEKQGGLPTTTAPTEAGVYTVVAEATGGYSGRVTATLEIRGYLTLVSANSLRPFTFTVDGDRFQANGARLVSPQAHTVVAEGRQVNALERYLFDYWQYSGGAVSGSPSDMPSTITTWGNAFFTAVPRSEYAVITNVTQGLGTVTGDGWYSGTSRVQLTATPAAGWVFDSFLIDGNEIRENGYFLSMAGAGHRVRVRFVEESVVTVAAAPAVGGTVTGSRAIAINTTTPIAAVAQPGFEFVRWDVTGGIIVGGPLARLQATATVRATSRVVTATAVFKPTMQIEFWSQQWYNGAYTVDVKLTNTGSLPITDLQLTEASSSRRVMQNLDDLPALIGTLQPGQSVTWQMAYVVPSQIPPPNYTLSMTFVSAEGYQYTRSIFVNLIAREP